MSLDSLTTSTLLAAVITFLICGIPFGLLIASKRGGIDVRAVGSGNIGTTNVSRSVGASAGILTLACDAGKGLVCTLVSSLVISTVACGGQLSSVLPGGVCDWSMGVVYAAAILGHVFSPYLHFHGGKGIAVGFGAALGFMWPVSLGLLVVFVVFAVPTRYVSLGSIAAAISLPILGWAIYHPSNVFVILLGIVAAVVVWAHRANIGKLMRGEEKRFSFHKTSDGKPAADDEGGSR